MHTHSHTCARLEFVWQRWESKLWKDQGEIVRDGETHDAGQMGLETGLTTSVTTTEYDVVKCEDFVSDPGRWVRHMPEEIRQLNPDFVPS